MKRKLLLLFCLALVFGLSPPGLSAQEEYAAPEPPKAELDYYLKEDFYFWEKDRTRILFNLYKRAVVLQFNTGADNPKNLQLFLETQKLTEKDGVKMERLPAPLGVREAKLAVRVENFAVLTFLRDRDIISLLNSLPKQEIVQDIFPVFSLDDDLVFSPGVWVKLKVVSKQQKALFVKKLEDNGYQTPWKYSPVPSGLSSRLLYFYPTQPALKRPGLNQIRLSRLLAEDILSEWSIPDFVSIRPLIRIVSPNDYLSGIIHDLFRTEWTIFYDQKRIVIDVDSLKKLSAENVRPQEVLEDLFRLERVEAEGFVGKVRLLITARFYQVGSYLIKPPDLSFKFRGGAGDDPALTAAFPAIPVKIIGLLPRDQAGNSLVGDIFPLKRAAVGTKIDPAPVLLPETNKVWPHRLAETLEKYVDNSVSKMKILSAFLIFLPLLVILYKAITGPVVQVIKSFRASARLESQKRAGCLEAGLKTGGSCESELLAYSRAIRSEMRRVVGAGQGATDKELVASAAPFLGLKLQAVLQALNELAKKDRRPAVSDIKKVQSSMRRLRIAALVEKRIPRFVRTRVFRP